MSPRQNAPAVKLEWRTPFNWGSASSTAVTANESPTPIPEPIRAKTKLSETTRATTLPRAQPMARSNPNSRVRSNRESSIVLPTITAPIASARMVLPVTAAFKNTRLRSTRPNCEAVRIVVSSGCAELSAACTRATEDPGATLTNTSETEPGTRL